MQGGKEVPETQLLQKKVEFCVNHHPTVQLYLHSLRTIVSQELEVADSEIDSHSQLQS